MKTKVLMAAIAALVLWTSLAFGQRRPLRVTADTPCPVILGSDQPPNLLEARRLLGQAQAGLLALPASITDASALASRDAVRELFERARELSGGDPMVVYSEALALRRMGLLEPSLHEFQCLQGAQPFPSLPQQVRDAVLASIGALNRDIDAARRAAAQRPDPVPLGPGPRVVGPVGPVVTSPRSTTVTPHPRSVALRNAGIATAGVGVATFLVGVVTTIMCAADAQGDRAYLNEANLGAPHGWSDARAQRLDQLCLAGPILLVTGAAIGGAGAAMVYVGGRQVIDPAPDAPLHRGTNGIPIISLAPTLGGGQASATWRF